MEDSRIVELYWARSESAIKETAAKYGRYCYAIAYNILASAEDADESVNDTYMGAWNSIPPHRPSVLSTYLGKIVRRVSINRWKARSRDKRGGGNVTLALDELIDCMPSADDTERAMEAKELSAAINGFLSALAPAERDVFVCRYWFLASVDEICARFSFSQSKVKSMLSRTRGKLNAYLQKEGLI